MYSIEQRKLNMLFGYETMGGRSSILWDNPSHFTWATGQGGRMLDDDMAAWKQTKRAFDRKEITKGRWIKRSEHGPVYVVVCHSDGTLTEHEKGNAGDTWKGKWELAGVALRINIGEYELDVIANKEGNTHSGIESSSKDERIWNYFKVIHEL